MRLLPFATIVALGCVLSATAWTESDLVIPDAESDDLAIVIANESNGAAIEALTKAIVDQWLHRSHYRRDNVLITTSTDLLHCGWKLSSVIGYGCQRPAAQAQPLCSPQANLDEYKKHKACDVFSLLVSKAPAVKNIDVYDVSHGETHIFAAAFDKILGYAPGIRSKLRLLYSSGCSGGAPNENGSEEWQPPVKKALSLGFTGTLGHVGFSASPLVIPALIQKLAAGKRIGDIAKEISRRVERSAPIPEGTRMAAYGDLKTALTRTPTSQHKSRACSEGHGTKTLGELESLGCVRFPQILAYYTDHPDLIDASFCASDTNWHNINRGNSAQYATISGICAALGHQVNGLDNRLLSNFVSTADQEDFMLTAYALPAAKFKKLATEVDRYKHHSD